jgi:serine protease DegS
MVTRVTEKQMRRFWRHFVSNGQGGVDCRRLGVHGHHVPLVPSLIQRLGLRQQTGLELWKITPKGPARRAGLRADDILLSIAEMPATDMTELNKITAGLPSGRPLTMVLLRDDAIIHKRAVLDE